MTPGADSAQKSRSKQWSSETAVFCDVVTDTLGFPA